MPILFQDGFESGDLSAWSTSSIDSGDLSAAAAAKLHGGYGLSCVIDDTNLIYVQDNTPNAETRYRCRFYLDPNSLTMGNGDEFRITKTSTNTPTESSFIALSYVGTDYKIRFGCRNDSGGFVWTSVYIITDAPHCIECDWKASSAAGANDGFISLWIDGVLKETVTGIDNDTTARGTIDFVQFGVVADVDATTSGTFYLDDFVSNNDGSLIGQIDVGTLRPRLGVGI